MIKNTWYTLDSILKKVNFQLYAFSKKKLGQDRSEKNMKSGFAIEGARGRNGRNKAFDRLLANEI